MSEQKAIQKASETSQPNAITNLEKKVREVLPLVNGDRARAEKIIRIGANAVAKTPALAKCDPAKLWLGIQEIAAMNLAIGARGAYLVPYREEVQVIVSPHGLIEMAYRHPLVKSVQARVVRKGEPFLVEYAPEATVKHSPRIDGQPGDMIGAYSIVELTTGGRIVEWMSRIEILKVKNTSQSAKKGYGPWVDWEEEMWRKTVLKRAMKYVPQSEDMMRALDLDDEDSDPQITKPQEAQRVAPGRGVEALRQAVAKDEDSAATEESADKRSIDEAEIVDRPDLSDDGDFE
jgi:recombination protein RecT